MTHIGTQYIETDRLILRRFERSDAQAMFDNWASDDEVTKYLTWPTHTETAVTKAVLKTWEAQYARDEFYNWAIVLKENGPEPIGNISVVRWDGETPAMGYCLGRRWWHRGIMSEALGAVLDFLFHRVGVERVEAEYDTDNPHSGGVMRKCGMTFDGVKKKAGQNNQGVCDIECYFIERGER